MNSSETRRRFRIGGAIVFALVGAILGTLLGEFSAGWAASIGQWAIIPVVALGVVGLGVVGAGLGSRLGEWGAKTRNP